MRADPQPRPRAPTAPGPLVARADALFQRYSPYDGDGFRNHCQRLFELTRLVLDAQGLGLDRDIAYAIAMTHDLGLVSREDEGETFLARSLALFRRETRDLDLGDTEPRIIDECMLYNHRVAPVPELSREAEAFRRAVWIEHSRGLRLYGLAREPVDAVFRRHPRGNFDRVLLDFFWRTVKREPMSIVHGVLW